VAEWLRSGLQSRLHRFDSGRRLAVTPAPNATVQLRTWYDSGMGRDHEALLRDIYAAFNARDIDAVLATMHDDVDWPNAFEGGRVVGRDDVRDYWRRQFTQIDPRVEPRRFTDAGDGRVAVAVHQLVRAIDGTVLADREVTHVYSLRDGLIARMDVIEP
jgi:ketosteroid isomerase-like protein